MSKKKFNPNAAFEAMVKTPANQEIEAQEGKSKEPEKPKYIQTGFYISEEHHKALKMKALMEDSDQSEIVRQLIENHLKEYMDKK